MTEEEARTYYPNVVEAVVLHERPEMVLVWKALRGKGINPSQLLEILAESADDATAVVGRGPVSDCRHQLSHPEFLRYVAAKLGAV